MLVSERPWPFTTLQVPVCSTAWALRFTPEPKSATMDAFTSLTTPNMSFQSFRRRRYSLKRRPSTEESRLIRLLSTFSSSSSGREVRFDRAAAIRLTSCKGDVQPFLALGQQLKRAIHRVRIGTHATFADFVRESELEFFTIGGDPKARHSSCARV